MPIQEQSIQFLESQVMADVPEGGGAATGTVIIDGEMNNVFEDISDLDRTMGAPLPCAGGETMAERLKPLQLLMSPTRQRHSSMP